MPPTFLELNNPAYEVAEVIPYLILGVLTTVSERAFQHLVEVHAATPGPPAFAGPRAPYRCGRKDKGYRMDTRAAHAAPGQILV